MAQVSDVRAPGGVRRGELHCMHLCLGAAQRSVLLLLTSCPLRSCAAQTCLQRLLTAAVGRLLSSMLGRMEGSWCHSEK